MALRRAPLLPVFLLSAIFAAAFPSTSRADGGGEVDVLKLFFAEDELVTAARRIPEEARTAPAVVQVFTAEEIERTGARTLSELLATLSSVYVSTQTSSRESVWFRGVRNRYNDKVLLLVDGVPVRDPVYEHAPIDEYLPLTNVERVEVIRGPGSALYGTNAYAGVIQIITKSPPEKPGLRASAGLGDHETVVADVEGGGRWGTSGLYAWAHYLETDGVGLDRDIRNMPQLLAWNPKYQVSGGLTFTRGGLTLKAGAVHYFHTFYADHDAPAWRWKDEGYWYDDLSLSARYDRRLSEKASLRVQVYAQDYDWRNFWRQFYPGRDVPDATGADVQYEIDVTKRSRRLGGELQFNWKPADRHEAVFGATFERESIRDVRDRYTELATGAVTVPYYIDPVSLPAFALYGQDTWRVAPWATLTAGLRADHHDRFGWHFSPRFGAAIHPGARFVAKLLYGEAYRAPSSREFFTVDLSGSFPQGNPALKPEQIRTLEAALSFTFSSYVEGSLVAFQETTRDTIYSENNRPYANYPGTTIRGAEAGVRFAWPNQVTARLSTSYTDSELYNVPRSLASGELNVPWAKTWNWNLTAVYVGSRPRDSADRYKYDPGVAPYRRGPVPSYLTLNSTLLTRSLWGRVDLSLSVYNLLNRRGEEPTFEPTKYRDLVRPGRSFLVRAGIRF